MGERLRHFENWNLLPSSGLQITMNQGGFTVRYMGTNQAVCHSRTLCKTALTPHPAATRVCITLDPLFLQGTFLQQFKEYHSD